MDISAATNHAIYFGWALAHIQGAGAVSALAPQAEEEGDVAALRGIAAALEQLQAVSTRPPLAKLPPQSDQLESALADFYATAITVVRALADGNGSGAATNEFLAALNRARATALAFGELDPS